MTGTATDQDGAPLVGVSISASSPELLGNRQAITDSNGYYRLVNLPPGIYTLDASLDGFAPVRQEGIEMRAGASFALDFSMSLGEIEDTIVVTGESPMLEMRDPGQVLTIDGDFQRTVPVQSRQNWSDVMEMTPGVHARPFDDGSGRMVYFGHATEHFAHVIQLEGLPAAAYDDAQATYIQMSTDIIADMEIKTSGTDASSPLGTGLVMNMVTKSGGNQLKGSAAYSYQPLEWTSDNSDVGGETSAQQITKQIDASVGGPLRKDKLWFFAAVRDASNEAGISRVADRVALLEAYHRGVGTTFLPFNNIYEGTFPYAKLSAQLGDHHNISAYYQKDEVTTSSTDEGHFDRNELRQTGGALYGMRLASVLSDNLTLDGSFSYNDKSSADHPDTLSFTGPQLYIYERVRPRSTSVSSIGLLLEGQNVFDVDFNPSSSQVLRLDFTRFVDGWIGDHEIKAGIFYAENRREDFSVYPNDGFFREYRVALDENGNPRTSSDTTFDLADGTIPYRQRIRIPDTLMNVDMEDRDIGVYLQDSWRPTPRLTINAGVRVDFIKRHDRIFDITRMDDTAVGPRLGISYLLTQDGKTLLRANFGRVHEQVNGRDFATGTSAGITVDEINRYDIDFDGVFETERITAGVTPELAAVAFDPDGLTQPYTDEAIIGFHAAKHPHDGTPLGLEQTDDRSGLSTPGRSFPQVHRRPACERISEDRLYR
ncbi:MAG: TonB-dependent receptor, partial [Holophagales bacterium]|nr:TonB-dependent receptor [Holophagales bacterium]